MEAVGVHLGNGDPLLPKHFQEMIRISAAGPTVVGGLHRGMDSKVVGTDDGDTITVAPVQIHQRLTLGTAGDDQLALLPQAFDLLLYQRGNAGGFKNDICAFTVDGVRLYPLGNILLGGIYRKEAGILGELAEPEIGYIGDNDFSRTGQLGKPGYHLADDAGTVDHANITGTEIGAADAAVGDRANAAENSILRGNAIGNPSGCLIVVGI